MNERVSGGNHEQRPGEVGTWLDPRRDPLSPHHTFLASFLFDDDIWLNLSMNPENPLTAKSRSAKSKEGTERGRKSVVEKNREEPQARGENSRKSWAQELMENTTPHRAVGEKKWGNFSEQPAHSESEYSASDPPYLVYSQDSLGGPWK